MHATEYFVNLRQCQHRKYDYAPSCGVKYIFVMNKSLFSRRV